MGFLDGERLGANVEGAKDGRADVGSSDGRYEGEKDILGFVEG